MTKGEIVMVAYPVIGHLISLVDLAKLITARTESLSATIFITKPPYVTQIEPYVKTLSEKAASNRLRIVELPRLELDEETMKRSAWSAFDEAIEKQRVNVKEFITDVIVKTTPVTAFIVDILATSMIDVANELGIQCYTYFLASAAMLGIDYALETLKNEKGVDITTFKEGAITEFPCSTFLNIVPATILPTMAIDRDSGSSASFMYHVSRFRKTKGMILNTFMELESHAITELSKDPQKMYAVGPCLNLPTEGERKPKDKHIFEWLDSQPASSVVFLCFGTRGFFGLEQLKEIATALEKSGQRFLWALGDPPMEKDKLPADYKVYDQILPEGFVERTASVGKLIGRAPQVEILSHPAIGGFICNCRWNTVLESFWYGVPIATWPMHQEQHVNAFQFVNELGIAVKIKMHNDDHSNVEKLITAEVIEPAIKELMQQDSEVRKRTLVLKEKSRSTIKEGGSSYNTLGRLVDEFIANIN